MVTTLIVMGAAALLIQALIGFSFLFSSILEREKRAAFFAALQLMGMVGVLLLFVSLSLKGLFRTTPGLVLLIAGSVVGCLVAYLLMRRTEPNQNAFKGTKGSVVDAVHRFDERLQVFARNRCLRPGSDQYRRFYEEHPDLEERDDKRRQKGGPLGQIGLIDKPHEGPNVAATLAALSIPIHLTRPEIIRPAPHPFLKEVKTDMNPQEASERVKGFARNIGADLVGIAEINFMWIYSHRGEVFGGNWEDWGKAIPAEHRYAVVVAEEMARDMIASAPHTPSVMESMKNYAKGAYIATQLAAFIANLGYEAEANHLRHYTAILPPLAVDAGLGEVGRLGYLMTREFGPRIRLSGVTTNLPLVPDKPIDIGVEDFCRICRKCAVCCPSQSIPIDRDPKPANGTLRWKLNEETCFEYWGKVGTDCCVCMRVCPWSHARTFPHRFIVWLITRNRYSRRVFSFMDDIFYGRKPRPRQGPKWAGFH